MKDLVRLAELLKQRNAVEQEITALIGRPVTTGHLGEYIASKIFRIALAESASQNGIDGHFLDGPLAGRSVNVKFYLKHDGLIAISPDALPGFYTNKAIVHNTGCGKYKSRKRDKSPNGYWTQPYPNFEIAWKYAQSTGKKTIDTCSFCC